MKNLILMLFIIAAFGSLYSTEMSDAAYLKDKKYQEIKKKFTQIYISTNNNTVVGKMYFMQLDTNPTTGYDWYPEPNSSNFILFITNQYFKKISKELPGSPSVKVWIIQPIKKGDFELNFYYYRIWEGVETAVKTNILGLTVR